jgi:hypothetical protein
MMVVRAVEADGDIVLNFEFTRPTLTKQANGNDYIVRLGVVNYCTASACVKSEHLGKTSTKTAASTAFGWDDIFTLSWDGAFQIVLDILNLVQVNLIHAFNFCHRCRQKQMHSITHY